METTTAPIVGATELKSIKCSIKSNYYKNGQPVFVYKVTGSAEDIAKYKAAQEANGFTVRFDEDGNPLFFSPRSLGRQISGLIVTPNNRVVVNDVNAAMSQAERFQDLILQERAKLVAARMFAGQGTRNTPDTTAWMGGAGAEFQAEDQGK